MPAVSRPIRIAVLTVSDTRTLETDTSGGLLVERLQAAGHLLCEREVIPDDLGRVEAILERWSAAEEVEVVLSTGGTGLTGRDVTVDVVERMVTRAIPGFGELFRWLSYKEIGASTIQSRAMAGMIDTTVVFALPGSTGACRLAWDEIIRHQLDIDYRPCNLVQLMPRFRE